MAAAAVVKPGARALMWAAPAILGISGLALWLAPGWALPCACLVAVMSVALFFESAEGARIEPETIRRFKLNLLGERKVRCGQASWADWPPRTNRPGSDPVAAPLSKITCPEQIVAR